MVDNINIHLACLGLQLFGIWLKVLTGNIQYLVESANW